MGAHLDAVCVPLLDEDDPEPELERLPVIDESAELALLAADEAAEVIDPAAEEAADVTSHSIDHDHHDVSLDRFGQYQAQVNFPPYTSSRHLAICTA